MPDDSGNNDLRDVMMIQPAGKTKAAARARRAASRWFHSTRILLGMPEKQLYARGLLPTASLHLPDFLIIGAQKAGTTWLKKNLHHHPELFLPELANHSDPTEVRYFDQQFHKSLRYYSSLFSAGAGKVKGEKSPNYCTLPVERIRFIRAVMPDVRLILMLRNPVDRAWSHALMNLVRLSDRAFEQVDESLFYDHFVRARERGDYLTIIDRWLAVFPREQLYIGFYDHIAERPQQLLGDIFAHLGVSQDVDWSSFPYNQKINRNPSIAIPEKYRSFLEEMYREDIETLYARFGEAVAGWRCLQTQATGA